MIDGNSFLSRWSAPGHCKMQLNHKTGKIVKILHQYRQRILFHQFTTLKTKCSTFYFSFCLAATLTSVSELSAFNKQHFLVVLVSNPSRWSHGSTFSVIANMKKQKSVPSTFLVAFDTKFWNQNYLWALLVNYHNYTYTPKNNNSVYSPL